MFSIRSRAVGAVFDDLVAFFRPTYSHVREKALRPAFTREDAGDAGPSLRLGESEVRVSIPESYEPPTGLRGHGLPRDSQGLAT